MMFCAPGDLGGADNPSHCHWQSWLCRLFLLWVIYREGTPLQVPTKWLNPRTYVAIKPRVGAHWGLYPAWSKNKVGRKLNLVKVPFPVSFPAFSAVQSTVLSFAVCGGGGVQLLWPLWGGTVAQHRIFHGLNLSIVQLRGWWGIRVQPSPLRSLRAWVD